MNYTFDYYLDLVDADNERKMNDQNIEVTVSYHKPEGENDSFGHLKVTRIILGKHEAEGRLFSFLLNMIGIGTLFDKVMAKRE